MVPDTAIRDPRKDNCLSSIAIRFSVPWNCACFSLSGAGGFSISAARFSTAPLPLNVHFPGCRRGPCRSRDVMDSLPFRSLYPVRIFRGPSNCKSKGAAHRTVRSSSSSVAADSILRLFSVPVSTRTDETRTVDFPALTVKSRKSRPSALHRNSASVISTGSGIFV